MWVCGVDGCRRGWVAVKRQLGTRRVIIEVHESLAEVLSAPHLPAVIGVDIPIGLLAVAVPAGRICDQMARAFLGRPRAASVFSPPVRAALDAHSYRSAIRRNRASSPYRVGISRQVFGLVTKLREADALMTPSLQRRVFEVHPELSFQQMNGGRALRFSKRSPEGRRMRQRLLRRRGFAAVLTPTVQRSLAGAAADDIIDACAVCWTAERIARGTALRMPLHPPRDARGLRMEIWC